MKTPKWVRELKQLVDNEDSWEYIQPLSARISKLLEMAATSTDDESLYEEIMKELQYEL